jgi:hypothetical protein
MIQSLKHWWQKQTGQVDTPLDGELPFFAVSLIFHLGLLFLLATILMPREQPPELRISAETEDEIEISDPVVPEIQFDDAPQEELGADSDDSLELAASEAPEISDFNEDAIEIDMPTMDIGEILTDDDLISASAEEFSSIPVRGSVGESTTGASGAVDRLTQEIVNSLAERKTLVVWAFDQSASLIRQREEIVQRFDKIYEELGMLEAAGHEAFLNHEDKALLTQVCGFGSTFNAMLDDPTDNLADIKEAINAIPRDDTGLEYVFSSVIAIADEYKDLRKIKRSTGERERNVMIVIVSDEAGDDMDKLDQAVATCKKHEIPVHVIGIPAPFGRQVTEVKWVDPDPQFDQSPQFAPVSQGPESVMSERLKLEFTGGDFEDLERIDSGFGPFALTRLCYETGGIYFAVHPNRRVGRRVRIGETAAYSASLEYFFDQASMRAYKPDYVSVKTYMGRLNKNKCRYSLVQAAQASKTGALQSPVLRFPKLNEANFANALRLAQRSAAILEPKMHQLYSILKNGEADRARETSLRWKAGFDLAYGRVIAAKIRAESYNAMLAMAKTKLKFQDPKNNTWVLVPADSISTGGQDAKLAAKAREYLTRVVDEHPGTPWAMLAKRELETPIGWEWQEDFTEPPQPRDPAMNNNNNNPRPVPQPRENAMPKQKRPPPKL